jgi:hypothetical protein
MRIFERLVYPEVTRDANRTTLRGKALEEVTAALTLSEEPSVGRTATGKTFRDVITERSTAQVTVAKTPRPAFSPRCGRIRSPLCYRRDRSKEAR